MRTQFKKYPFMSEDIQNWDGKDYDGLERRYLAVWRMFFAGDFQQAREEGLKLGAIGKIPSLFSQLMYAIYLADRQSTKYMMLQDVANQAQEYFDDMKEAEDDPEVAPIVATVKLGYAYAIARIAEESPVPIVVARRYIGKIKTSAEEVVEVMPEQPLAHAFRAGVDAGIMRRVGKFTGRMTYGARTTTVEESFAEAMEMAGDIPIVNYEYANALIYMNRKRDLNEAISYLEKAMKIRPEFSMDALDVMYSYKRLQEVRLYALNFRSFRKFEKLRRKFSKQTDRNLTSIISEPLSMDMLNNPGKYVLPERG
jgi:tetratricopeptide (TPR) repeat protein